MVYPLIRLWSTGRATMLREFSTGEHDTEREILTVVVIHRSSDRMPGPGFLEFTRSLGHDTKNRELFWTGELEAKARDAC